MKKKKIEVDIFIDTTDKVHYTWAANVFFKNESTSDVKISSDILFKTADAASDDALKVVQNMGLRINSVVQSGSC